MPRISPRIKTITEPEEVVCASNTSATPSHKQSVRQDWLAGAVWGLLETDPEPGNDLQTSVLMQQPWDQKDKQQVSYLGP